MDAQGALDSLLGRLTTVLVNEAQLLGGVRGDVEFIKEEMESMNGLLLHLTESHHRDHQVRAWMKHVIGLTRDCEGNVELYIRHVAGADPGANKGLLGYLRRVVRFVRTVPARHRVAMRIQELKVRARDVGDRRLRYGITVPAAADQEDVIFADVKTPPAPGEDEDFRRRAILEADGEQLDNDGIRVNKRIDRLVEWLLEEAPAAAGRGEPQPMVFPILWNYSGWSSLFDHDMREEFFADRIAQGVYCHPSVVSSFGCKARVCAANEDRSTTFEKKYWSAKPIGHLLREILEQVVPLPAGEDEALWMGISWGDEEDEARQLAKKLQGYLKDKRFLIVIEDVREELQWDGIRSALLHADDDCPPDCAIIMTTPNEYIARSSFTYRIFKAQSILGFFYNKVEELFDNSYCDISGVRNLLQECSDEAIAMKMVLHLYYVNPRRSEGERQKYLGTISKCHWWSKSVAKQAVRFSYNDLPSNYRSCLLYLTIFPENDCIMRRTTVCRRWIAEGLIATRDHVTSAMDRSENRAQDEADCCFDALVAWGFVRPGESSAAGKIKSCTLHDVVREVITRIATDVNFVDTDLPANLAHHLSIHSRVGLQASHSDHPLQPDGNDIVAYLPYLAKSSQWQLLKVLDLEGCKGLKKHHLKSICKILLLKYLCLRNTDVTELPKQIERLQCLETLDIRQTAVRTFATKSIMLPMLKHLLAGQTHPPSNNSDRFQESFVTVRLPGGIQRMTKLQILSHVAVCNNVDDLSNFGQLLQLRKLGVILHDKKGGLALLFQQIEKLHGCLRSLSIRINQPTRSEGTLVPPPKLLQSLNISGITGGLPLWIAELNQLTKLTLSKTDLGEDALRFIGKLRILRCLRLRFRSYSESKLTFKEEEFQSLKSLIVEGSNITNIAFDTGAAPKLEMIVWSFDTMESLSGIVHLPNLKKLVFNGDCNPKPVRQAIKAHPNDPDFKHNGQH